MECYQGDLKFIYGLDTHPNIFLNSNMPEPNAYLFTDPLLCGILYEAPRGSRIKSALKHPTGTPRQ
jgi:hypothetical protein